MSDDNFENFGQEGGQFSNDPYSQNTADSQEGQPYQTYRPYQPSPADDREPVKEEPVKMSEFFLILALCTFIPCVGIIFLFIYGFSKNEKQSKKNFCRAYLIVKGIGILLSLAVIAVYVTVIASIFR